MAELYQPRTPKMKYLVNIIPTPPDKTFRKLSCLDGVKTNNAAQKALIDLEERNSHPTEKDIESYGITLEELGNYMVSLLDKRVLHLYWGESPFQDITLLQHQCPAATLPIYCTIFSILIQHTDLNNIVTLIGSNNTLNQRWKIIASELTYTDQRYTNSGPESFDVKKIIESENKSLEQQIKETEEKTNLPILDIHNFIVQNKGTPKPTYDITVPFTNVNGEDYSRAAESFALDCILQEIFKNPR